MTQVLSRGHVPLGWSQAHMQQRYGLRNRELLVTSWHSTESTFGMPP